MRLRFNEAQMRLYDAYRWFRDHRMPVRIIICKSRRAGLSTGVEALMFDDTIRNPNTNSLIIANQLSPSTNLLNMCVRFWLNLPKAMRFTMGGREVVLPVKPALHPKYGKIIPTDRLEFASPLNSALLIASSKSVDQYLSYDFQNHHFSEASRYDNARELFRAVGPTLSDDPQSAQYIESTPNGQSGKGAWFCEQVMDAAHSNALDYGDTKLVFVPWHEMIHSFSRPFESMEERSAFERSLKSNERDIMLQYPGVTLEQMHWRRIKLKSKEFNMDEELFDQEYPSDLATAFLSTGESILKRATIKRLMANVREPVWEGDVYWGESDKKNEHQPIHDLVRRPHFYTEGEAQTAGFASHVNERTFDNLRVWRWPNKGETLIIGADIGRGNPLTDDGDPSAICVVVLNELQRDELIMTWRGKLNVIAFGDVCAALAWGCRYRVGSAAIAPKLAPEWQGPGNATCTYIDEKRLYELDAYRMPGVRGMPKTKHIGWESNSKTKPYAVGMMIRMIETDTIDIPSEEVVLELSSYRQLDRYGDEGSYGGVGSHDDFVSAFQIACAICRLETSAIPSSFEVAEINPDESDDANDLMPFDEIGNSSPDEQYNFEEYEEEEDEEHALFWG